MYSVSLSKPACTIRYTASRLRVIVVLSILCTGPARALTGCSGEGQRACRICDRLQACDAGITQVGGCVGDCESGVLCATPSSTCIKGTACGNIGSRASTSFDWNTVGCSMGVELPGCSGDCTSAGSLLVDNSRLNLTNITSSGTCGNLQPMAEPTTNCIVDGDGPECALLGYADMHLHMFSHLGLGGASMVGKPYEPIGGVNEALKQDFGSSTPLFEANGEPRPRPACPGYLANCGSSLWHGNHYSDNALISNDKLGGYTNDGEGHTDPLAFQHSPLGAPVFNGWPTWTTWTTTVHQQVYFEWLRPAWQGGLRLATVLAVTSEAGCRTNVRTHTDADECRYSMLPPPN